MSGAPIFSVLARSKAPPWSRALALWLCATAFVVSWAPSADGDIWWHLAAGRQMVRTHSLLWTDPFSSGAAGRPWIDVHWLFQVLAYALFSAGGLAALVLVKAALVAAGAWVLRGAVVDSPASRRAEPLLAVTLIGGLFLTRQLLLVRPVIPTLLLVAVFFRRLESFRRDGRAGALLWLPLLQVLWSNLQGLFALGPALVAAYAAGAAVAVAAGRRWPAVAARERAGDGTVLTARRFRWLVGCLVLCLLACLVTPFGLRGPLLAWRLLMRLFPSADNVYSANIAENVPPWSLPWAAREPFWHLRWFLALLVASFFAARRRLVPSHCLLATALIGLGLMANRNILLLYWLGAPIVALNFAPTFRAIRVGLRRRWRRDWRWAVASAALLPIGLSALAGLAAVREPTIAEPAPWRAPEQSAAIIDRRGGAGTIFAADNFGGYLIWKLYPRFRPYMDTRLVLRTADEFAEYLALADDPASFDAWEQRFRFDYVVLQTAYPDRYLGLVAHLYANPTWTLVFTDGTETLFARAATPTEGVNLGSPATTEAILAQLAARFGTQRRLHQAARLQLAILDLQIGSFVEAERALAGLEMPEADIVRAHCRLALEDTAGAQAIADRLLRANSENVPALDLLALLALRRGNTREAVGFLKRALAIDPVDGDALRMVNRLELNQPKP